MVQHGERGQTIKLPIGSVLKSEFSINSLFEKVLISYNEKREDTNCVALETVNNKPNKQS